MLPLYTSYVSAADYGRIELLMATMAVAVVLIRGGANFGFIRFYFLDKDPDYRRRLIRTVFWTQMAYATAVLVLCVAFAQQIARRARHHGRQHQHRICTAAARVSSSRPPSSSGPTSTTPR